MIPSKLGNDYYPSCPVVLFLFKVYDGCFYIIDSFS